MLYSLSKIFGSVIISLSNGLDAWGEGWDQHSFLIDTVPTILNMPGVKLPLNIKGFKQSPIDGDSIIHTSDDAMAAIAMNIGCKELVMVVVCLLINLVAMIRRALGIFSTRNGDMNIKSMFDRFYLEVMAS